FRLAQTKGVFEDLDGWFRRKLRAILWRQWKRPRTRARKLMLSSPLKKASLTGFHPMAKHIAAKAVSPSSETMRTI
ncbi:MAG: hypothetical protein IH878_12775, partial [Gemmatimonadetes bacterium]|nr:hypothetical protein [Gemmatimonadota bacterium]